MAWLTEDQIKKMGFKHVGKDVKLSDKASYYYHEHISIGDYSRVDDFCVLNGSITLGAYVHLAVMCNLAADLVTPIVIDEFTTLAYNVHVVSVSDDYTGESLVSALIPKRYRPKLIQRSVYIKRHCIVGTGSCVLPGVTLAEGTSVGAMSLIRKNTEEWSIYVGIPAKRIKERSKKMLLLERQFLADQQ